MKVLHELTALIKGVKILNYKLFIFISYNQTSGTGYLFY